MILNTKTVHTPKNIYRLWWGAADQCPMPHCTYPYNDIDNPELYNEKQNKNKNNWKQAGKNNSIA